MLSVSGKNFLSGIGLFLLSAVSVHGAFMANHQAFAQTEEVPPIEYISLAIEYVTIPSDQPLTEGTLISLNNGTYSVTTEEYSKDLFGVITANPAVELQPTPLLPNAYPLIRNGETLVKVNGKGGAIKAGDLVTSSDVSGQATKANKSGFILGVAQADFSPTDAEETTLIPVLLDIKFAFAEDAPESERIVSRLMSVVSLSTISVIEEPIKSLRYIVAGLTILLTLVISFLTFGRVAYKGVEALGRNPLAKNSILVGIVINSILGVGLAAIGLATAYTIITW
jgi:F0F1-type ATP synthase membrane subunit c/vacuolar-type H+-ATPase subunit K